MQSNSTPSVMMERMTVKEVRDALQRTRTVIVPVGVTEQHGYHLPLCTDSVTSSELARCAGEATGALVAPALTYNFSGGTLPGTINISPPVVTLLIQDVCRSLALQGFRNIIILPGHGGTESVQALRDAADLLLRNNPELKDLAISVICFWELSETAGKAFAEKDFHAGYLETSMMLYWRPELVRKEYVLDKAEVVAMMLRDQDAYLLKEKPVDDPLVRSHSRQHPAIEVGVMGFPQKADPSIGEALAREVVTALTALIRKMEGRFRQT